MNLAAHQVDQAPDGDRTPCQAPLPRVCDGAARTAGRPELPDAECPQTGV